MTWQALRPELKGEGRYLSVSQAKLYRRCPRSWKRQYRDLEGAAQETSSPMILGSAVHAVLQQFNQFRLKYGRMPDPCEAVTVIDNGVASVPTLPADKLLAGLLAVQCLKAYLTCPVAMEQPVFVEQPFLLEADTGLRLYGVIDLSTPDGVWDYKITTRAVHREDYLDQLNVYAHAYQVITGRSPGCCGLINFVKPGGRVSLVVHKPTVLELTRTLQGLQEVWDATGGNAFPAQAGPHCDWCTWSEECQPADLTRGQCS